METATAPAALAPTHNALEAAFRCLTSTYVHLPPPNFRLPGIAVPLNFVSTTLHSTRGPKRRLEGRQSACRWTPLHKLEERMVSSSPRPKASQHLCACSSTHAGERCNVDGQANQVVCDSRTAGSTTRALVARSAHLSAGAIPHPILPTISTERHPLPLQVRHAPSPVERKGCVPDPGASTRRSHDNSRR